MLGKLGNWFNICLLIVISMCFVDNICVFDKKNYYFWVKIGNKYFCFKKWRLGENKWFNFKIFIIVYVCLIMLLFNIYVIYLIFIIYLFVYDFMLFILLM